MESIFSFFSKIIQENFWLGPLAAFIAGILTSITPCALSSVPLVIGYVGNSGKKSTKKAFFLSICFAAGLSITFTALGVIAASAGSLFGRHSRIWLILLGILMFFTALQTAEIITFFPSLSLMSKNKKRGHLGAFLVGILAGLFSSPCSTPVLIVLLGIIAGKGRLLAGIVLMLFYSAGYSSLTIAAGTSIGFVQNLKKSPAYAKSYIILKYIFSVLMIFLGIFLFYQAFL